MASLLKELFKGEFVIDEPRERLVNGSSGNLMKKNSSLGNSSNSDLFTQISEMLLEHARLELLAQELRQQGTRPNEEQLSRFFRMSLSVLDGFERLEQMRENSAPSEEVRNWLKSVDAISSRFSRLCESFGLQTMNPVGKSVDLDRHEVVEVVRTDSLPDETVVEVRQKGYIFNGKILRDASVVVAKNERR